MFRIKRNEYLGLWILLTGVLAIVIAISFMEEVKLLNHTFKQATFARCLTDRHISDPDMEVQSADSLDIAEAEAPKEVTVDSLPQSIFIFGDSMTFNLALRLAQYAKQNGHVINSVNWDSSNTKIWAESDTLNYYIRKYRPTQIFITLGSNEIYFKNPEVRVPYVRRILEMIDTIPYVWIGPPNWKKDTGINDMLQRECRPGTFFRSEGMEFKRKADHIHPTRQSSALWVDSIMRWLPKSAHPFVAEVPSDSIGKCNPHIVFLKALNK